MMRPRRGHVRQDQQERRASSKRETPVAAAGSARPRTVVAGIGPTTSASGGTNERTDGVPVLPVSGDGRAEPDHDGDKHPQIVPHTQIPMQPEAPPPKPATTLRNGNPRGNPNAAPPMRRQNPHWLPQPSAGDEERPLPHTRRRQHPPFC